VNDEYAIDDDGLDASSMHAKRQLARKLGIEAPENEPEPLLMFRIAKRIRELGWRLGDEQDAAGL
jgi:hypothetical protein